MLSINRFLLLSAVAVLSTTLVGCRAARPHSVTGNATPLMANVQTPPRRSANEWSIELGSTIADCRRRILWHEVPSKGMLSRYPFDQKLAFLIPSQTVVWSDGHERCNGWPRYLLGVFSGEAKDCLVDLIEVRDGFKIPRVSGVYQTNLYRLHPGMSTEELRTTVGIDDCRYERATGGTWRVVFAYLGFNGEQFVVEVDASSGIIVSVRNGAI